MLYEGGFGMPYILTDEEAERWKKAMETVKISAVILAAGQGKRMGSQVKKQYMTILDKPVLYYSIHAFQESSVDEIIVVTEEQDIDYVKTEIVDRYQLDKVTAVVAGGKERFDSAYAGIKACQETDYVLIHDGARPLITPVLIETVIKDVRHYRSVAVGVPSKDTIKIVDEELYATKTPPRKNLWAVQTPQAFSYALISQAYRIMYADERSKEQITDDAMVVETYMEAPVKMILGDYENIKITTPEDIIIAELLLKRRNTQEDTV
jgi:2-C-methyl-D-erythritol 4-phosphate cytidylyltransferase